MNCNFTRNFTLAAACLLGIAAAYADAFETPADNPKRYTMADLAAMPESGVTQELEGVFVMANDVVITAPSTFSIDGTLGILMADSVTLQIDGYCDFSAPASRVLVSRTDESSAPAGIKINYDSETEEIVTFRNIDFEYAGLRNMGVHGFDVDSCTFANVNGVLSSAGALAIGTSGACFSITNSRFEDCAVPAIGGAANYFNGLYIADCEFVNNNTANTNKPQLNLTVGADLPVTIKNCVLTGSGLNMVGGIAVGNLVMANGANQVTIEGCTITDHRYGITGVGPMNMQIRDNVLKDNNHEDNPMNGGSGISLSGYGYELNAIVSGNHIENSLWGITIIYCNDVNLGEVGNEASPGNNVFVNNGNNGTPYDLYNNSPNTVYAQNNTWSVPEQTAEEIETVIFHKADNSSLGEVIFMPAKGDAGIAAVKASEGIILVGSAIVCDKPVEIYDAMGRCVARAAVNPSIAALQAGIYVAKSGQNVLKFVKR